MALAAVVFAMLVTGAVVNFRRPARWLAVFTWLLPFHVITIAFLVGYVQLPVNAVRAAAAWKEAAVLLVVLTITARSLVGLPDRVAVSAVDAAVGAFGVLTLIYFVGENTLLNTGIPLVPELYGLRDSAFFTLLYFVGRATPEVGDDRTLRRLFWVGVVTSAVAILERLFVAPEILVMIGAAMYYQEFLGIGAFTTGNDYGLVDNYWTQFGDRRIQRAGSVYLGSMSFAISFVLIIPAATLWLEARRSERRVLTWIGYGIAWTGLLLSITRMSIITCALQVLLIALLIGRPALLVGIVSTGVVAFAGALAAVPKLPTFVWETLTWQTGSSTAHLHGWAMGFNSVVERPLGSGLATGDVGLRFGLDPVSSDNVYLKYAGELGVLGLVLHVIMMFAIAAAAWKVARHAPDVAHRRFGIFVFAVTLGVAFNAMTTVIFHAQMLSYLFFWVAGTAVTLSQQSTPAEAGTTGS